MSNELIKLYKFRPLGTKKDFDKAKEIIEKKVFHCSKLWDLNDPTEGVYKNSNFNTEKSKEFFKLKNQYLICSFSGEAGFKKNQLLWGYYANGFRGIVVEVQVKNNSHIRRMDYLKKIDFYKNMDDVESIITRKLWFWEKEDEYRFFKRTDNNKQKIGKIENVYFGNPYGNIDNWREVYDASQSLQDYFEFKDKLEKICRNEGIKPKKYTYH